GLRPAAACLSEALPLICRAPRLTAGGAPTYHGGAPFGRVNSEMTTSPNTARVVQAQRRPRERAPADDATRCSGGRSARDARVIPAKTRGPAHLEAGSGTRQWEAAAPLDSANTPAQAHFLRRGRPGATITTAPGSFHAPRIVRR